MTNRSRWGVLCGTAGSLASAVGCQIPNAVGAESDMNGGDSNGNEIDDDASSAGNETSTGGDDR